jgi:stage II sporulation protein D
MPISLGNFVRTVPTMRTTVFLCLLALLLCSTTYAQHTVKVGICDRQTEREVMVSPVSGKFHLITSAGDTVYRFRSDDVVSVTAVGDSIKLVGVYGLRSTVKGIDMVSTGRQPSFLVKRGSDGRELRYPGALSLRSVAGKLILVNNIALDTYVSHVVQSESGISAPEEYYKIQSIICRTYFAGNRDRHGAEGFDVCDHQHCQVYEGNMAPIEVVAKAAAATSGIIMADADGQPILAAFHANCGGQTANSGDVWAKDLDYLISVKDTFCLNERSARWEERVQTPRLKDVLPANAQDVLTAGGSIGSDTERMSHLDFDGEKIRTADVRRDLRLRSAFFKANIGDEEAVFSGRGFGHGVGLCQQGAMQMARSGLGYRDILGHYYHAVALVNLPSE